MRPVFILGIILLLVGCKQRDERVLMVDEQGSFAVGGTVLVDSLGHTFHGDHAYVFYQKPVGARKYPLVFAHGQARSCRLALHLARPQGRCKALRQGRRALRRPHRRGDGRRTHGQPLERGGQALRRGRGGGAPSGVNGDVRGLRRRLRTAWTS